MRQWIVEGGWSCNFVGIGAKIEARVCRLNFFDIFDKAKVHASEFRGHVLAKFRQAISGTVTPTECFQYSRFDSAERNADVVDRILDTEYGSL
jgi:hypothetical protein